MINEILEKLGTLELNDLEVIKKKTDELIKSKQVIKKVIYKHDCFEESNYHQKKYKHWAKELTGVDDNETNGYAFKGRFLKVDKEDLVNVESYVIEVCSSSLSLYIIKEHDKELLKTGKQSEIISFIKEVKEVTKL